MPRLTVRPEAELDALDAGAWYDGERPGLGTVRRAILTSDRKIRFQKLV
jgi:hypothetical protein